ncbi:helix-turn-helix domain-containing protein [Pseudonocardia humida]|uniref:Helix-turn-helix domain-containing protein n=1 Tax=Pseudonocardia humida TaxID=2800819 RepID=A0ABT1A4G0_9PSEU|nr:helix-turn-helix transcriptional regulator [Pseudonocardia humida]MCO1657878.1 helix-turn-helix domain-containing protein [Pseudonocardia humida]
MSTDAEGGGPPEVNRRRVRNILRDARESVGLTQKQAADRVLWSLSKMIRIETGAPPQPSDVRVLLKEYGFEDERISEVVEYAKAARRPGEWEQYRDVYTSAALNVFENERAARLIQKYEPSVVPGLLQTEDYARELLASLGNEGRRIEKLLMARLQRQEMLERIDCPKLDFILGEATISRPVGRGSGIIKSQIERLKVLADHPNITLRFLPFSAGLFRGMGDAFTVLEFRDPEVPDLVYLESADRDSVWRDEKNEIARYAERFGMLQELASPPEDFVSQITAVARNRFD